MNSSQIYLGIAIAVFVILTILFFLTSRKEEKAVFTPLSGLSMGFILIGILFGDDRIIGYGLLGIGVVFAVVDMVQKLRKNSDGESH